MPTLVSTPIPAELVRFRTFGSQRSEGADEAEVYDLLRGRLRFKDVTTFNDPFEARPHHVPAHSDAPTQRAAMVKYLASIMPGTDSMVVKRRRAEQMLRGKGQSEVVDHLAEVLRSRNRTGETFVFCMMHPDTVHTPLPWSHYGDAHQGICLHFTTEYVPIKFALPVTYGNDYPTITIPRISNEEELSQTLLRKARDWGYEQEWRVIQFRYEHAGIARTLLTTWDGDVALSSRECVRAVTIGCAMAETTKARLIAWIKSNAAHVELWQARLSRTSYRLERDRIC